MVRMLDPEKVYDIWTCRDCGVEYPHARLQPGLRGGPHRRGLDRRYGYLAQCWANKACPSHKRKAGPMRVMLIGPGAPNPEQPLQEDLDNINRLIEAKQRRSAKRA